MSDPAQTILNTIKARSVSSASFASRVTEPGTLLQITYDPNFQGRIAELAVGEPPVHLQLQADLIEPVFKKGNGSV